jgi:RNA polymerase sigma factor (sigma-70 family)
MHRNEQDRAAWMDPTNVEQELERLHPASFGWAMACCQREREWAEDVLQNAYLKVLDGRARFDGRAGFKTWFFAVIRRTAADERRRSVLRRLKLLAYGEFFRPEPVASLVSDALERTDQSVLFQKALAVLPRRQREVLDLVFYHDLTVEQAAEVMGVSIGSARTHYDRGKRQLGAWFGRMEYGNEYQSARR